MPDVGYSLDAALAQLQALRGSQGARACRLVVRKFNPGGMTGHQTVEVERIDAGVDWEAGRIIITPAQRLTELSPEDVEAIRTSVRSAGSWHAYQRERALRDRITALEQELAAARGAVKANPQGT